ncbi:phage major capsid protein [Sphingobacterium hotanense]|uniref:Phage major capsid protein n=1 Tax=Sphingobacterium hotanense TaxID=649196 RepID=A0ABT7NQV8_9SPHI|nr:phage major capsid protein [Sphingobacterium hotanense]MDM1049408.1 phage major capsid protein [Sphingobacterium hotanense]
MTEEEKKAQEEALALVSKTAKEEAEKVAKTFEEAGDAKVKSLQEQLDEVKKSQEGAINEVVAKEIKVVQDRIDRLSADYKKRSQIQEQHKQLETVESLIAKAVEENHDNVEKFIRKESKSLVLELKAVGDISTGSVDGDNYGRITQGGIHYLQNRKAYVSDLIAQGTIGPGNDYYFMREISGEGAIAPHQEGGLKSQFDLRLEEANTPVETIAGWTRATRKAMQNIPGFMSWLQVRIPDLFKKVLDYNVLYGTGTNNELKGILHADNHIAQANYAAPFVEKLMDAITLLEDDHERDANIGFLRPIQYNSLFKNKADGSGEYDLPAGVTFVNGVLYVLGVPFYKTTALNKTNGDFVVGDRNGAQLLTQNPMRIELFDQDRDNVIRNLVTVRVEGEYALPLYGNDFFVKGTSLPFTPPVGG